MPRFDDTRKQEWAERQRGGRADQSDARTVLVDYEIVLRETAASIQIGIGDAEMWIPRSCITSQEEPPVGSENGVLRVMYWFARKNSIPYREVNSVGVRRG